MENKTLLQKAKEIPSVAPYRHIYTEEDAELALAWIRGEVSTLQVNKVTGLGKSGQRVYTFVSGALKQGLRREWLKVSIIKSSD